MPSVPFYRHDLGEAEIEAIREVLAGPILTTGDAVLEFERKFASYLGVEHALGVTSCTGAIHMSLLAFGIGDGDEVITTPMTFIASSTAILEAGATPVFVDVEPTTGNLDAGRVEEAITPRTRAILPVHLYGQMCDMRSLRDIADRHGLRIIEDAAHCIEGDRDGVRPGQLGDTACFSFYATKNLTSGEGGAVTTNDAQLAEKLRLLRLHGMTKTAHDRDREGYSHWDMVALGWKYNMDNIHAALLLPQLDRLESKWEVRETTTHQYRRLLGDVAHLGWPEDVPQSKHARHLFTVWIDAERRDQAIRDLHAREIQAMVNYRAIHLLTYLRERLGYAEGAFPIAERIGAETVSLPFYPGMPTRHLESVADTLRRSLGVEAGAAAL